MISLKEPFVEYLIWLQNSICLAIEEVDGQKKFQEEKWEREGGGGGITRVIQNGGVFEKGGVNFSKVYGNLSGSLQKKLNVDYAEFIATGISLVLHPLNPMVPTVHANFRYFELYDNSRLADQWFGGGMDLTPYYIFEEDAFHFHSELKKACDTFSVEHYPEFKSNCDNYFFNSHRNEARGIGGIFFDYLKTSQDYSIEYWFELVKECGNAFMNAYIPIVKKRVLEVYGEKEKEWQEIRRGRYVEFNLIHDRGTLFGLKTGGRIESILMSLPPKVRWIYNFQVEENSRESDLLKALEPKDWINNYEISQHQK